MIALFLVLIAGLIAAAFVIVGHIARIADAVEAQNRHYGIGDATSAEPSEEEVA